MPHFFVGIDLGGTNVKAGIVADSGKLIARVSLPTAGGKSPLSPAAVIARIVEAAQSAILQSRIPPDQIQAVGILSPGQANYARGLIQRAANFPLWKNVPLRAKVSAALNLPAHLENDANAAAFGEWWTGAGLSTKAGAIRRPDTLFMLTLGTGVGGGLVYHGKIIRGSFGYAAEAGHMILFPGGEPCGCGQRGCVERYCSATYSALRAENALRASKKIRDNSSLGQVLRRTGTLTSADIQSHAQAGDHFAREAWDSTCRFIALACVNVCHLFDPDLIVIGGGMSHAGRPLLAAVKNHFRRAWWTLSRPTAKIVLAKLGNDAGIIGAAGLAREAFDRHALPPIGR